MQANPFSYWTITCRFAIVTGKTIGAVMDAIVGFDAPEGWRGGHHPVALVGEAPGADEVRQGKPFVGRAGRLLFDTLARFGIRRSRIWVTNVFWQRPPGNRIDAFFGGPAIDGWPSLDGQWPRTEVAGNLPRLVEELRAIRPRFVVAAGRVALWALTGIGRIGPKAGQVCSALPVFEPGFDVFAVRHPAWALRASAAGKAAWENEIRQAAELMKSVLS